MLSVLCHIEVSFINYKVFQNIQNSNCKDTLKLIFDWSLKYHKRYHKSRCILNFVHLHRSLGDGTTNDQEIVSEISGLFLLQLSDSLMPGYTMSLSGMKWERKWCLHFLRSSNPQYWQTAANGTACILPWGTAWTHGEQDQSQNWNNNGYFGCSVHCTNKP